MITLKSPQQIAKMRAAGRVVRKVLNTAGAAAVPGITTGELEDMAARIISEHGGTSPFLGYAPGAHPPFPAWTCISVNEEVVHGVPGRRVLKEGDIVTIDCGVELDGWIADSAWTFGVGKISPQAERLLKVTEEALYKGIEKARKGNRTGDIGYAVQKYAETHGFFGCAGTDRTRGRHGTARRASGAKSRGARARRFAAQRNDVCYRTDAQCRQAGHQVP